MALYTFDTALAFDGGGDSLEISAGVSLAMTGSSGLIMPTPWQVKCALVEPGNDLTPPTGGQAQRIGRLGARWQATFSQVPALGAAAARAFLALRNAARATAQTMVFLWPQPGFTAAIGAPVVNGAGQLGSSLVVDGLAAGAQLAAGTFFSVVYNGRNNLHCLTAAATADGSGAATLAICPMLRGSPATGAGLAFAEPAIEGFIQGKTESWTLQVLQWTGLPAFSVMEPA